MEYDPHAFAIELKAKGQFPYRFWAILGAVILVLLLMTSGVKFQQLFFFGMAAAALFSLLSRLSSGDIRTSRVILNVAGLHYCPEGSERTSVPWTKIGRVRQCWINGDLILSTSVGRQVLRIPRSQLDSAKYVRTVIDEINKAIETYRSDGPLSANISR